MYLRCAFVSAILYLPLFLLTPWISIDPPSTSPVTGRILRVTAIALRSTCTLFVAASAIAAIPIHDIHRGLAALPLPAMAKALIVQLVNQTVLLMEETIQIIRVLELRGTSGMRGIRVIFSFPVVWMVRMLFRAERSAAAMAVRGYGMEKKVRPETVPLSVADKIAILCTVSLLFISLVLRLRDVL